MGYRELLRNHQMADSVSVSFRFMLDEQRLDESWMPTSVRLAHKLTYEIRNPPDDRRV